MKTMNFCFKFILLTAVAARWHPYRPRNRYYRPSANTGRSRKTFSPLSANPSPSPTPSPQRSSPQNTTSSTERTTTQNPTHKAAKSISPAKSPGFAENTPGSTAGATVAPDTTVATTPGSALNKFGKDLIPKSKRNSFVPPKFRGKKDAMKNTFFQYLEYCNDNSSHEDDALFSTVGQISRGGLKLTPTEQTKVDAELVRCSKNTNFKKQLSIAVGIVPPGDSLSFLQDDMVDYAANATILDVTTLSLILM